jgi:hypothetical protein
MIVAKVSLPALRQSLELAPFCNAWIHAALKNSSQS